jgi:hypothetical protein
MKIRNFLILAILGIAISSQAQDYKSAIGLRLGVPLSVSYKTFINEKAALEFVVGYRNTTYWNYFSIGAYYQHHMPIQSVDGLSWYVGGGASAHFWSYDDVYYANTDYGTTTFGISGCIGLDYKFAEIPLNLSVDWIPTFYISSDIYDGFRGGEGALAVRYTLN